MSGYDDVSRERWVPESGDSRARGDFPRDRARLVHSAALRRLAQKTQMHQPTQDDFVRNRLTHSLEVAQIGREFGAALGCDADVVDTACLAHDLGHPPFGHNGEAALDALCRDIGGFEGNSQTLRLLTRLEAKRTHADGRPAGLNLTRACLDASLKYPWARGDSGTSTTKFGVYAEDRDAFDWVRRPAPSATPTRLCLEAQVMDWADDVAYSVHDVEDAIASEIIDPRSLRDPATVRSIAQAAHTWYGAVQEEDELASALDRALTAGGMPRSYDGTRASFAALKDTTSHLIGHFVREAEGATRERFGPGELTRFDADVVIPDSIRAEVLMLKAVSARFVLMDQERSPLLGEQRKILAALYDGYVQRPDRLDPLYRTDFEAAASDSARARSVVDQIASLTDGRAYALTRRWI